MPVINLTTSVIVAKIYRTWVEMPLIYDERLARVLSLKRRECNAADAENASIASARARYHAQI